LLEFPFFPAPRCGPIGDAARPAPSKSEWKRPFIPMMMKQAATCDSYFLAFFTYSRFYYRNITLYEGMSEDKKIAKILIEGYI
jgi:hypothetical protein